MDRSFLPEEELSLRSIPENPRGEPMLFPSPITPDYINKSYVQHRDHHKDEDDDDGVDDACRSFENYLVEMIVEEGKVGDLSDVEELLYCWKNLKSPVFIHLVCRFYGELCKDLFSSEDLDHES
ncbi:transcription repressor OFP17-like [Melia azedarach]|uniref:Transcription repressor OFP17-like n=1 Tax=Melia azedarach TaxID=155640 RepID=A0ACC1Y810_MELAZ|nr:transcription repressor OFP17-like [Melia azedarach]